MNSGPAILLDYFVMLKCGNANKDLPSVKLIKLFICVLYHYILTVYSEVFMKFVIV